MALMPSRAGRNRRRRHTVATVICHGVAPFEMAVPCEVFGIDRCGFGTAAGLRLHFRRVLDRSPLVYRRTFRRIGA